jgi:dTMP kinase
VLVKSATRKGKKRNLLTPTTFSLIHATDFADRYERQMLPLLRAGYLVLADRYMFTAFARDAVRGVQPSWVRSLYSFAREPDMTLYFRAPLQVALDRILFGRPQLKYHEAGMDLGLAEDSVESFRIFQGLIMAEYEQMIDEYGFEVVDATQGAEQQQAQVRDLVSSRVDLPSYRWRRSR